MYKEKFSALRDRLERDRVKRLELNSKAQEAFYSRLSSDLYRSNKEDCSVWSDKFRRKRASYCANKLRQ